MASDQSFVDFVADQMSGAGSIQMKKMFGEYAVFCDGKVVALICNNQLFVKPTIAGRAFVGTVVEAPAYKGAKLSFLIDEQLDDRVWLGNLVRITANELPTPKPKKKRAAKK